MSFLITSDWHLNDLDRDEYRWRAVEQIISMIEALNAEGSGFKEPITTCFVLGDLTDDKDNHSAVLVNRLVHIMRLLAGLVRVVILRGNHDAVDPRLPFFQFLDSFPRITFIKDVDASFVDGVPLVLVPHGVWPEALPARTDLILAHTTFAGAMVGGYPLPGRRLPLTKAPIVSGDVHVPQRLGPVHYVGAPTNIDFGDDWQPRVLVYLKGRLLSYQLHSPTKRLVTYRGGAFPEHGMRSGDVIKVKVEGVGITEVEGVRQAAKQWAERLGLNLYSVAFALPKGAAPRLPQAAQRSDRELVVHYGQGKGFDQDTIAAGIDIVEPG